MHPKQRHHNISNDIFCTDNNRQYNSHHVIKHKMLFRATCFTVDTADDEDKNNDKINDNKTLEQFIIPYTSATKNIKLINTNIHITRTCSIQSI